MECLKGVSNFAITYYYFRILTILTRTCHARLCTRVSFTSGSRAATPRPRQELPLERGGPPNEVLYYWRDATYERT